MDNNLFDFKDLMAFGMTGTGWHFNIYLIPD